MKLSKHVMWGAAGSLSLLVTYFLIVGSLRGAGYAISNFIELKYYMIPLVAGFGAQSYLFSVVRSQKKAMATGGVSALSMAACCAHRATDILPFLGASAIGVFVLQYQKTFLAIGIFSNALGILYMIDNAKKSGIVFGGHLSNLANIDFKKSLIAVSLLGMAAIAFTAMPGITAEPPKDVPLDSVSLTQGDVTFEVRPTMWAKNSVKFEVSGNTHTEELDFDYSNAALLSGQEKLRPSSWSGPSGGHHLNGILEFPPMMETPKTITLSLGKIGKSEWSFEWDTSPYFS